MVQLTKVVSTGVANLDYRDSPDHSVESIGDDGAAPKDCMYKCCNYRFKRLT
jgi:hypothetical protein